MAAGILPLAKNKFHLCAATLVIAISGTAGAQVLVNAPNDNSVVSPTFYLHAEAPTCESLPTGRMAYSIDSGNDVASPNAQSLQTMVTVQNTVGPDHTLTVKAWNVMGSLCERTLSLQVGDSVNVSAPAQGSRLTSPFILQAEAPTCGGEHTVSMAYELDNASDTGSDDGIGQPHDIGSAALKVSVTAPTGSYVLRVKARGDSGAYCEADISLNVDSSAGLVPPTGASSYAHMEDDGTYAGTYANCGGANGANINLWQSQPDCATVGIKTGSTSLVSTPIYGWQQYSREFAMTYDTSGGGVRWFDKAIPGQFSATHFQYDAYVNIVDNSKVGELELDINHAIISPVHALYILGAQCNLTKGLWQVSIKGKGWVNTNASCTRAQVASGVWHHFQVQAHHDPDGGANIYYDAVAIDGNVVPITSCTIASTGTSIACVSTSRNPGWGGLIGPNFQIDGTGPGGTATAYMEDFTVFYW